MIVACEAGVNRREWRSSGHRLGKTLEFEWGASKGKDFSWHLCYRHKTTCIYTLFIEIEDKKLGQIPGKQEIKTFCIRHFDKVKNQLKYGILVKDTHLG